MAFCRALTSSTGPTIRDVPVSTTAWQPPLQRLSCFPTSTLRGRLEREQQGGAERQDASFYYQHMIWNLLSCWCNAALQSRKHSFKLGYGLTLSNDLILKKWPFHVSTCFVGRPFNYQVKEQRTPKARTVSVTNTEWKVCQPRLDHSISQFLVKMKQQMLVSHPFMLNCQKAFRVTLT